MPIHYIYIWVKLLKFIHSLQNKIVNVQLIKLSPCSFPCTPPTACSQKGWLTTLLTLVWILLNYFQVRWRFKIRRKVFLSDVTEETIMSSFEKECLFWLVFVRCKVSIPPILTFVRNNHVFWNQCSKINWFGSELSLISFFCSKWHWLAHVHLSWSVDKYCRVAKKNGRYVGMFQLPSSVYSVLTTMISKGPLLPFMTYKFPGHFPSLSGHWKDWQTTGHPMWCEGKPTMLSLLWYFFERLVIVSRMYNYGAASPTWILALAKLTREGLFESYQLMQTTSATTSTMKWCHSVRLLHSKCTSVPHAMHQSGHGFLVMCIECVCVCVCVCIKQDSNILSPMPDVWFLKRNFSPKIKGNFGSQLNLTTFGLPLLSLCCYLEGNLQGRGGRQEPHYNINQSLESTKGAESATQCQHHPPQKYSSGTIQP